MTIRQMRTCNGLTQAKCADYLGIPLRTYKRYESDESKIPAAKNRYITELLSLYNHTDEEHGVLTVDAIKKICGEVFSDYPVEYCYLFGSYAKGKANEKSDVDLLVSLPVNGLMYYELLEVLREKLKKKVDLLDTAQLGSNLSLTEEILKDGIKIYG